MMPNALEHVVDLVIAGTQPTILNRHLDTVLEGRNTIDPNRVQEINI